MIIGKSGLVTLSDVWIVTVGCVYTISLPSVENKEMNKLVLKRSRKSQE
jgi:hypothetical protein